MLINYNNVYLLKLVMNFDSCYFIHLTNYINIVYLSKLVTYLGSRYFIHLTNYINIVYLSKLVTYLGSRYFVFLTQIKKKYCVFGKICNIRIHILDFNQYGFLGILRQTIVYRLIHCYIYICAKLVLVTMS